MSVASCVGEDGVEGGAHHRPITHREEHEDGISVPTCAPRSDARRAHGHHPGSRSSPRTSMRPHRPSSIWNGNAMAAVGAAQLPPTTGILTVAMVQRPSTTRSTPSLAATRRIWARWRQTRRLAGRRGRQRGPWVLAELLPDQADDLQAKLDASLGAIEDGPAKDAGIAVGAGRGCGVARRSRRRWSRRGEPHHAVEEPGGWRPAPPDMAEYPASLDRQGDTPSSGRMSRSTARPARTLWTAPSTQPTSMKRSDSDLPTPRAGQTSRTPSPPSGWVPSRNGRARSGRSSRSRA